jgi:hypothetical protein
MILRTTTGRSFKGVGKYVLHDKGAQSSDRVAFVETENCAFRDGQRAIAEMIHTAAHQKDIKRRNGGRATQTSKPVYHMSLSWDTSEKPTLDEQMSAAREAIKALGVDDRQALIVGHTDTDNPHVHVVVNLVCPTTGKTASIGNDRLKLSQWAEQYRKERGQEHLTPQRKKNNDRRRNGEFVKADNMTRPEYEAWKKAQAKEIWDDFRADRAAAKDARKGQFDALWQQKENRFAVRRDEIRQLHKPLWRDLFKAQNRELREYDQHFAARMKFALRQSKEGKIKAMFQAVFKGQAQRMELVQYQEEQRQGLATVQKARIADASREVMKAYKYDLAQLKEAHRSQDQERYDTTKAKAAEVWKDQSRPSAREIAEGAQQGFEKTADRRQSDNKAMRDHLDSVHGDEQDRKDEARERREKRAKRAKRERQRERKRGDGGRTMDN